MRLLLDQNLSWRLVSLWGEDFPGTAHVRDFGMTASSDAAVWTFARAQGFVIVSKDGDFDDARMFPGPPPKAIHLAVGNASTADVDSFLRARLTAIRVFEHDGRRLLALE